MPKTEGPRKSNRYPDEFKIRAVKLADQPDHIAKDVTPRGCHRVTKSTADRDKFPPVRMVVIEGPPSPCRQLVDP